MLEYPKRLKFKKLQKGKSFNKLKNNFDLKNIKLDSLKLISTSCGRVSSKQINAIRLLIRKALKKRGVAFFRIFPHTPITKKPSEIRMGKGKGAVDHYVSKIRSGSIICEIKIKNILKKKIIKTLKKASIRLPINTRISK